MSKATIRSPESFSSLLYKRKGHALKKADEAILRNLAMGEKRVLTFRTMEKYDKGEISNMNN
ncbi:MULTISPECIES: hypothetical protein [Brevibacillus]